VFRTQDEAITYARRITKRGDKKVVLHERNGEIVKIRWTNQAIQKFRIHQLPF